MKTTLDKVKHEIAKKLEINPEVIDSQASLDDLGANELDSLEILMAIENEFEIDISDSKFNNCNTVGAICALVESLKRK